MKSKKFGTFDGVIIPSLEAIIGAILFLILPALVGNVGLITVIAIILVANTISVATTFSIANCITNLISFGTGGIYQLIRKSLGVAFGGSVGIQLYLAQVATIAFTIIGFSETLHHLIASIPMIDSLVFLDNKLVISFISFIMFFILAMIGSDFTIKIQKGIIVTLFIAIIAVLVSVFISNPVFAEDSNVHIFDDNFNLSGLSKLSLPVLLLAFASFFPALKGITVGISMSGELKTPQKSIVKGTFIAIIAGMIVYLVVSAAFSRINRDLLVSYPLLEIFGIKHFTFISLVVFAGIILATFSATLSYLMSAPRILSSMISDRILPRWTFFLSKDFFKKSKEPRIALVFSAILSLPLVVIGDLNIVAAFVGIAYLAVYSWINFSAFLENVSRNPSFRPTAKIHWSISLYGFLLCTAVIFMFNATAGIIILLFQFVSFIVILKFKSNQKLEGVWWGVVFSLINFFSKRLVRIEQGSKNWRPVMKVFIFHEDEKNNENIVKLGGMIADYLGAVNADIIYSSRNKFVSIPGGHNISNSSIFVENMKDLTQAILVSANAGNYLKIKTNTILIEYNRNINWKYLINEVINSDKSLLIYKDGTLLEDSDWHDKRNFTIDVWWKENDNGNLNLLLAYIIFISGRLNKNPVKIRIIHKLDEGENIDTEKAALKNLMEKARLQGEVIMIENDPDPIEKTVRDTSAKSDLVLIGLTDVYKDKNIIETILSLNKDDMNEQINRFSDLPPILFVKAAYRMNLIEE